MSKTTDLDNLLLSHQTYSERAVLTLTELKLMIGRGALLKNFRSLLSKTFSDDEIKNVTDSDIINGVVSIGGEYFQARSALESVHNSSFPVEPELSLLMITSDVYNICRQCIPIATANIPEDHMRIMRGVDGGEYITAMVLQSKSTYFYMVNYRALVIINDDKKCFNLISLNCIIGNYIAGRDISQHMARYPTLHYLAHSQLHYSSIGAEIATQYYDKVTDKEKAYLPDINYDHGNFLQDIINARCWEAIKKTYSFDIHYNTPMHVDLIMDTIRTAARLAAQEALKEEVVEAPEPEMPQLPMGTMAGVVKGKMNKKLKIPGL